MKDCERQQMMKGHEVLQEKPQLDCSAEFTFLHQSECLNAIIWLFDTSEADQPLL